MLPEVVALLRCPVCGAELETVADRTLGCAAGHRFDLARQGHLTLLAGATKHVADTAEMVAARVAVQSTGRYDAIADALAAAAVAAAPDHERVRLADLGGGTGFYASRALAALAASGIDAAGVGIDLSKHAAARAARAHPRLGSVVADVWAGLPLRDRAVDVALSVFAPRNAAELARVVRPGGALVVVTPLPEHLGELVGPLGMLGVDPKKPERLAAQLDGRFSVTAETEVRRVLRLDHGAVVDLVRMGPSAFHTDPDALRARVGELGAPPVAVTVAVRVTTAVAG